MSEDIFDSVAGLEKRADEVVARAKAQAKQLRQEVDAKLEAMAEELERDHGLQREEVERVLAQPREKLFREFEHGMEASLAKLEKVRREKVAPLVAQVIKAFLEQPHGD